MQVCKWSSQLHINCCKKFIYDFIRTWFGLSDDVFGLKVSNWSIQRCYFIIYVHSWFCRVFIFSLSSYAPNTLHFWFYIFCTIPSIFQQNQQLLFAPLATNQYYESREVAVTEVEKTIGELGSLFKRLATMITEQGVSSNKDYLMLYYNPSLILLHLFIYLFFYLFYFWI